MKQLQVRHFGPVWAHSVCLCSTYSMLLLTASLPAALACHARLQHMHSMSPAGGFNKRLHCSMLPTQVP